MSQFKHNRINKLLFVLILSLAIVFSAFTQASANPLLFPFTSFFSAAGFVAEKIASAVSSRPEVKKQSDNTLINSLIIPDPVLKEALGRDPLPPEIVNPEELKKIIAAQIGSHEVGVSGNADTLALKKKLDLLDKLYEEGSVDIAEAIGGEKPSGSDSGASNAEAVINRAITPGALPALQTGPANKNQNQPASDLVSKLKNQDPNSSQFKSIFEKFKENFKPETKSYLEYSTDSSTAKKILPPDFEVKGGTGVKLWQDKLEDNQIYNKSWSYGDKPQNTVAEAYTSNFLNTKDDPNLSQNTLLKTQNSQFSNIRLEQGNTKFGWTHIAYDRPDGTCHAREIKEAFGLQNQDGAVRDFIQDTIQKGQAQEQVRDKGNGNLQHRMLYTRNVDGKEILVVVDNDDKYRGSVITAYPTGNVKAPSPAEIQKRIEEEKKKLAEEAKKNQRWREPSISVDFYKNEIGRTIGPQVKAGTDTQFKLGGATVSAGAKGDVLLIGAEAKGASYVGIRYGNLAAGVQGSVFAGSRARGEVSTGIQVGQWGGRAFAGGEVSAGVGANADAHVGVGTKGAEASVSGDAFVGVRAKGQIGGTISHGNTSVTASVNGTVGAGLGAHFEATGKISWTGIKAKVNLGAYLGIGGQLGFDINVNFGDALKPVQKVVGKVFDEGKKIAKTVGENIKNGLDNARKAVASIFKW